MLTFTKDDATLVCLKARDKDISNFYLFFSFDSLKIESQFDL